MDLAILAFTAFLTENVILQELQSGYMYKERLLRPALVKVNKKEGK